MTSDPPASVDEAAEPKRRHGNGSVAHQIIGEFIVALEQQPQYADVVGRLSKVVFDGKVTETTLGIALFGDLEL